jgi:hypothetical protein
MVVEKNDTADSLCTRLWWALATPGWPRRTPAVLLVLWAAFHLLPDRGAHTGLAAVALAGCLANLGRIGTHLQGKYLLLRPAKIRASSKPEVRCHLNALVIANLALTLLGTAGAILLMAHPEAPLFLRVGPISLLCLAFYAIALGTVDRAGELGLDRGTEIVRKSRFGGWLFKIARKGTKFPPAGWLVDLFDDPTPSDEPSTLALVIAVVLLFAPTAGVTVELSKAGETQVLAAFAKSADRGSDTTIEEQEGDGSGAEGGQCHYPDQIPAGSLWPGLGPVKLPLIAA